MKLVPYEGAVRRNVVGLAVFNLFRGLSVGGYQALFSLYMAYLGYSMGSIGLAVAAASFIGVFLTPLAGFLVDTRGSRPVAVLSGLAMVIAVAILIAPLGLPGLVFSYTFFMLSFLYGQPARMTFLARSVGVEGLGVSVGAVSSVFSFARSIGPAVAGFIAYLVGFTWSFLFLLVVSLIGTLFFYYYTVDPPLEKRVERRFVEAYRVLLHPSRSLAIIYLIVGLDRVGWSLWFPMLSAHMYNYGYNEALVGVLASMQSFVQAILLPLAGRLTDKLGPRKMLGFSEALGAIAALLFTEPTPLARAVTGYVVVGVSIAAWIPSYNKLVAEVVERDRLGEAYASANTVRSLASSPAPLAGGYIYDVLGPAAPYLASAVILFGVISVLVGTRKRQYTTIT